MKKALLLTMALAVAALSATASKATLIVDTGEPPTAVGDPPFLDLKYAGEFTLEYAAMVTSIEHFMLVEQGGLIDLRIYNDGGDVPGGLVRTTGFRFYGTGGPEWRGVSGLDWSLPAGTYWVSVEPQQGGSLVGRTYKNAPFPLGNEVRTLWSNSPWFEIDSYNLGWRVDGTYAAGSTEDNPILPSVGGSGDPFAFDDVSGSGNWFDPPAASGYVYETDGASNFTEVGLPLGVPDADGLYTVSDSVNGSSTVAAGVFHTFATPIDKFTVLGINPTVNGDNPQAFPTFLAFDQSMVDFTMTPIPEPSTLALVAVALCGLASARCKVGL